MVTTPPRLLAILVVTLVALLPDAHAQDSSGSLPALEPDQSEAPLWRWAVPEREPFKPWHTDRALQQQAYREAYEGILSVLPSDVPDDIPVMIVPTEAFDYLSMESGAKDGPLLYSRDSDAAMARLGLRTAWRRTLMLSDLTSKPSRKTGRYIPKHANRQIGVSADLSPFQLVPTLRHEFVHAVQDQTFSRDEFLSPDGITLDEQWARQAMEEGSAFLIADAQASPAVSGLVSRWKRKEQWKGRSHSGNPVPAAALLTERTWKRRIEEFLYLQGAACIQHVVKDVGDARSMVDLVFTRPPATTRAVLHPELYAQHLRRPAPPMLLQHELIPEIGDAVRSALLSDGGILTYETRCGELGLQFVLVELGVLSGEAVRLASPWRNDQLRCYGSSQEMTEAVSVWLLASTAAAGELSAVLRTQLAKNGIELSEQPAPGLGEGVTLYYGKHGSESDQALVAQLGQVVLYGAGQDLEAVAEALGRTDR